MTKKYSEKYPELFTLLCGYFNQDWDLDYDSPELAISSFARDGDKQGIEDAIIELETLLQENHTKEEWLRIIYDNFGCFCNPEADGINTQEWLKKVKKQLEEELALAEKKEGKQKPSI